MRQSFKTRMQFSFIRWDDYDLKPLADLTALEEEDLFGIFDSEAGFHINDGVCANSREAIVARVSETIIAYMGTWANLAPESGHRFDIISRPAATMAQIKPLVGELFDRLNIEWSSPARDHQLYVNRL